jgi:hypothetical protein
MGDLLNLVDLIYDAALDTPRWNNFLDAYVKAVEAQLGLLIVNADHGGRTALFRSSNWPAADIASHAQPIAARDWYQAIGKDQPEGTIRIFDDLCRPNQLQDLKPSRDPAACLDLYCGVSGVVLRSKYGPSLLVAMRARRQGRFDSSAVTILRSLMTHLRRAALLQNEMTFLRLQVAVFNAFLDRHPIPSF